MRHTLNKLTDHVYWYSPDGSTDRPILGAVVGEQGTLLIDAGNSINHIESFLNDLTQENIPSPTFVTLTHWHWDHVFGTAAFDVPIIAHEETTRMMHLMQEWDWRDAALDQRVVDGIEIEFCRDMIKAELSEAEREQLILRAPNVILKTSLTIDLGNVICHIDHIGGDHAADSCVIHVPQDRVLFIGDCIYQNLYDEPHHYTPQKLFPLIERLLAYDANFYIPSHHEAPLSQTEMIEYTTLLKTVGEAVVQYGEDLQVTLDTITAKLGSPLPAEDYELIDFFLAGLEKTQS